MLNSVFLKSSAASLALLSGVVPVFAQDGQGLALEEITVTARKIEETLQTTPVSITAFTAADLDKRGYTNISQIGEITPNMQFDSTAPISGASNASSIFIRGIGQTDFLLTVDPGVGVYVDGVYMARSIGGVMDLLDLERVEVLRGPQGTLFGRNTIGGAISLSIKKPGNEFEGQGEVIVGRYDRIDARLSLNVPIVEDKFFARVSASTKNRDGYGRRILTGQGMGNENSDSARLALRWVATETVEVNLAADVTRAREESPVTTLRWFGDPADAGRGAITDLYNMFVGSVTGDIYDGRYLPPSNYESYATGPTGSDTDIWGVSMIVDWDMGGAQAKSITAYRDLDAAFGRDPDGSPLTIIHTDDTLTHKQFSQELQFSGTAINDRLKWLVGAYYFSEKGTNNIVVSIAEGVFEAIGAPISINGPTIVNNKSYAAFANFSFNFTDQFSASAGIRWSKDKKRATVGQEFTDIGVPVLVNPTGEESFKDITPKFGLEYRWTEDVMTYASFAQGFKSGGFTGRYVIPTTEPRPFNPEKVTTYELGFKSQFADDRVRLNGAVFYSDYKDIQIVIFDGVAPQTRNAAKGRIKGGELELTALATEGLMLTGAVGYLDAKYTEFDPLDSIGLVIPLQLSNKFVNTPEWSMTAAFEYTFSLGDTVGDLVFRGDWSYRSKIANDAINTEELIQNGYSLVNARLTYRAPSQNWELSVFGTNLTDVRYITSGVADKPSFGLAEATWARPREWGASAKFRF